MSSCREMNADLLKKKFAYKCEADADFDETIQKLLNKGIITAVKKTRGPKYYISDSRQAIVSLKLHGYDTTPGKIRKL